MNARLSAALAFAAGAALVICTAAACVPDAPAPTPAPSSSVAPVTAPATAPVTGRRTVTLNGQVWEYVDGTDAILYCELPLKVGIDVDDKGNEWAGCM